MHYSYLNPTSNNLMMQLKVMAISEIANLNRIEFDLGALINKLRRFDTVVYIFGDLTMDTITSLKDRSINLIEILTPDMPKTKVPDIDKTETLDRSVGRPPIHPEALQQIEALFSMRYSANRIADELNISTSLVYKYINQNDLRNKYF